MAYIRRSKLYGYDNIAAGSATGQERTITGVTPGAGTGGTESTTFQNADNTVTSSAPDSGTNTSFITGRAHDLHVGWTGVQNVTDSNVHGPIGTADADQTPTSATTPGYTSTTSFTSFQAERVAWTSAVFP